jgi:hypothetical protein
MNHSFIFLYMFKILNPSSVSLTELLIIWYTLKVWKLEFLNFRVNDEGGWYFKLRLISAVCIDIYST